MNILFCNFEYPPLGGGGGVVMAALARALARRHAVTVLTSRAMDLPAKSLEDGVRVLRVPVYFRREQAVANFPSMFAYLPNAAWRGLGLRHEGFDVVNTHFVVPTGPVGHFLAGIYGVPNVLSVHGGDLYDPSKRSSPHRHRWLQLPIRRLLRKADALVAQSRDTQRHVADLYRVSRPIELIPLGIERPAPVANPGRAQFGLPRDAFVLVTVGRVVARKNTVQLIRALSDRQLAHAHLLIVGDGPDVEHVMRAATAAGVASRVKFLGQVSEETKNAALDCANVFVSTSQHEGFGLVFLEAMAFGLPIVCYDHGGQTDFLATGETGSVVPLGELDMFTQAIVQLDDARLRAEIAANNRVRVEHYFIDRCAERYEELFAQTIEQTPRAGMHPRASGAR